MLKYSWQNEELTQVNSDINIDQHRCRKLCNFEYNGLGSCLFRNSLLRPHQCSTRLPKKKRARLGKSVFPVRIFIRLMGHRQTKWRSRTLPRWRASTLLALASTLLGGTVAAIPNLTGVGLARYNSFQGPHLSGKYAIYRRLARRTHILTLVVSGKNRSAQVRQNYYTALLKINTVTPFLKLLGNTEMCANSICMFQMATVTHYTCLEI